MNCRVVNDAGSNGLKPIFANKSNCGKKVWGAAVLLQTVLISSIKSISISLSLSYSKKTCFGTVGAA